MNGEKRDDVACVSLEDAVEVLLVFVTGPVIGGTLLPGLLLCVPGLILFGAAILAPIVLAALVAGMVAIVAAVPYLMVRGLLHLLRPRR